MAKYVAVSALEASFDVRSMARTSTKVFVLEVMGRHAGWIAAAGGLVEDQGIPVVILFPEIEFDERKFVAQVDALVRARLLHGRRLGAATTRTAVSSPNRARATPSATPSSAARRRWSRASSKQALGVKFHWAVADYLQRAARHIASATDVNRPTNSAPER